MSSNLYILDGSSFPHSSEICPSDLDLQFLLDPIFPFQNPSLDFPNSFSDYQNSPHPSLNSCHSFHSSNTLPQLSFSPPSHEMNSLSLGPTTLSQSLPHVTQAVDRFTDLGVLDTSVLKLDKAGLMQRSFSIHSLDQKQSLVFQPHFLSLLEAPKFRTRMWNSTENSGFGGTMRRACSTGDLHILNRIQSANGSPSYLASENSFIKEPGYKVSRYSAEERKQRIHKYRNKRTQRNFHKTIKYACRKTLADSRVRVRGRFARNDQTGEISKGAGSNREEEEEEQLWVDGFSYEDEEMLAREHFSPHFQYLGF
ncbi:uncharacterized protein LOC143883609 [Tasmannia lanceolata]|uniref:uncharacterized protein LOC143883609 n=1 Tax=Tasmannia lanceolata TaxID=3420 RepID=UPI00406437C3